MSAGAWCRSSPHVQTFKSVAQAVRAFVGCPPGDAWHGPRLFAVAPERENGGSLTFILDVLAFEI